MCKGNRNQCHDHYILQIQAAQKIFMTQISHELRTPLTKILSSAELIELSYETWSDEKKLRYVGLIQEAALELMQLLNHNDFDEKLRDFAHKRFGNHP
jgi:signal transduction histidine kinase